MCGRFTVVGEDGLGLAMEAIEAGSWDGSPADERAYGRLDRSEARPTALVQVVARDGGIVSVPMIWGFSVTWQRNVVFNARIERADDAGGMWSEAFAARRCIVPVWTFFEPHRSETAISPRTGRTVKRQYAFASPDGTPLLLAGIYDRPLVDDGAGSEQAEPPPSTTACRSCLIPPNPAPGWKAPPPRCSRTDRAPSSTSRPKPPRRESRTRSPSRDNCPYSTSIRGRSSANSASKPGAAPRRKRPPNGSERPPSIPVRNRIRAASPRQPQRRGRRSIREDRKRPNAGKRNGRGDPSRYARMGKIAPRLRFCSILSPGSLQASGGRAHGAEPWKERA